MEKIEFTAVCGPTSRLSKAGLLDLTVLYLGSLGLRLLIKRALASADAAGPGLPGLALGAVVAAGFILFALARILKRRDDWALYLGGAIVFLMLAAGDRPGRDTALEVPLAVLPLLPAALVVVAFLRMLRHADELQRRILNEALAFAFAVGFIASFAYAFLEGVGFPRAHAFWFCSLLAISWAVGIAIFSRRYR
jgi:hypothetical protein